MIPQSDPHAGYVAEKQAIDRAIADCLQSGRYILGPHVEGFEAAFADSAGARWAIGVANGTDALELALRACGVAGGDLVATVSNTAVATASAISRIGAGPVFVDVDPRHFTMDPTSLELLLQTPSVKVAAIVPVHLFGQPADMDAICEIAERYGIPVIEDCAQAHGALAAGKGVGNWGALGCFSFYPTKNLAALGDGGAIIGSDPRLLDSIKRLRQYGWAERYISSSVGFNSRLDELQAAILAARLPYLTRNNEKRRAIAKKYEAGLAGEPFFLPEIAPWAEHVFHQFVIRTSRRDELQRYLSDRSISTLVHYPFPIHRQPAYAGGGSCNPVPLTVTDNLSRSILSLPNFPELTDDALAEVIAALKSFGKD